MIYNNNVDILKITSETCKKNKKEISGKIKDNEVCIQICYSDLEALKNLPTTHTFPKYRSKIDICKNVLIKHQGLLADTERKRENSILRRDMPEARSVNLHSYVFSYHGIHDPYYANYQRDPMCKSFGVFIDLKAEDLPHSAKSPLPSIATYRDLASPQKMSPLVLNFLLPQDARELLAKEVKNLYNSIWKYWGESQYSTTHWEKLYEFHFHKKVSVNKFLAVIWPLEIVHNENTGERSWDQEELKCIANFKKCFNDIKVCIYEWHHTDHVSEFLKQSLEQAKYYLKYKCFSDNTSNWFKKV